MVAEPIKLFKTYSKYHSIITASLVRTDVPEVEWRINVKLQPRQGAKARPEAGVLSYQIERKLLFICGSNVGHVEHLPFPTFRRHGICVRGGVSKVFCTKCTLRAPSSIFLSLSTDRFDVRSNIFRCQSIDFRFTANECLCPRAPYISLAGYGGESAACVYLSRCNTLFYLMGSRVR